MQRTWRYAVRATTVAIGLVIAGCSLQHRGSDARNEVVTALDTVNELAADAIAFDDGTVSSDTPNADLIEIDAVDAIEEPIVVADVRPDLGFDSGPGDTGPRDTGPGDTGPPDAGIADVPGADTRDTAVYDASMRDTGMLDASPPVGACGGNNQPCCEFGACTGSRVCAERVGDPRPLCHDCGNDNQPCCAFAMCNAGTLCTQLLGQLETTCQNCGGNNEPCCAFGRCNSSTIVCTRRTAESDPFCRNCGRATEPCCAGGVCDSPRVCRVATGFTDFTCN